MELNHVHNRGDKTGNGTQVTADQLTTDATKATITLNKFDTLYPNGGKLVSILLNSTAAFQGFSQTIQPSNTRPIKRCNLTQERQRNTSPLTDNQMGVEQNGSEELAKFISKQEKAKKRKKLGGMLLKTYDSDIFNNWVKTDWIDGAGRWTYKQYTTPNL